MTSLLLRSVSVQRRSLFAGFGLGAGAASAMPFTAAIPINRFLFASCPGSGFGSASHVPQIIGEWFANWWWILIAPFSPLSENSVMLPIEFFKSLSLFSCTHNLGIY
ncbi:hypothetical protein IE877_22565 [Methylomonas sp. EbA]|uniref:Uncharacterized protein n=1 Tax=Methylomonas albis TaxID=1854563 RepID=A0ABR9D672_9GAMM|nr:hypothetical protein [Methylomonas albis]MBD9358625.1 hypothetical protein [Methylomonas albis]